MSSNNHSKQAVEEMVNRGSLGLVDRINPDPTALDLSANLSVSAWVENSGNIFTVYIGPECPLVMSNKLGNELSQKFPELSDKIMTVNKMKSQSQKSNLMMVASGLLLIDCKGNVATTIENSAVNSGRFSIAGGLNSEYYIQNNSIQKMQEQLAAIGIPKGNSGIQKYIDTINDLDYEKFPLNVIEQYYCDFQYNWEQKNSFPAYAYIDSQKETLMIIKIGYFDGILTQSIDASNWKRSGAVVNNSLLTSANSTSMLAKTISFLKANANI